jgi:hypothetical protein
MEKGERRHWHKQNNLVEDKNEKFLGCKRGRTAELGSSGTPVRQDSCRMKFTSLSYFRGLTSPWPWWTVLAGDRCFSSGDIYYAGSQFWCDVFALARYVILRQTCWLVQVGVRLYICTHVLHCVLRCVLRCVLHTVFILSVKLYLTVNWTWTRFWFLFKFKPLVKEILISWH